MKLGWGGEGVENCFVIDYCDLVALNLPFIMVVI